MLLNASCISKISTFPLLYRARFIQKQEGLRAERALLNRTTLNCDSSSCRASKKCAFLNKSMIEKKRKKIVPCKRCMSSRKGTCISNMFNTDDKYLKLVFLCTESREKSCILKLTFIKNILSPRILYFIFYVLYFLKDQTQSFIKDYYSPEFAILLLHFQRIVRVKSENAKSPEN